jgi:hypothetical protein
VSRRSLILLVEVGGNTLSPFCASITVDNRVAKVWDVVGIMKGAVEPDRYVVLGNHRDAYVTRLDYFIPALEPIPHSGWTTPDCTSPTVMFRSLPFLLPPCDLMAAGCSVPSIPTAGVHPCWKWREHWASSRLRGAWNTQSCRLALRLMWPTPCDGQLEAKEEHRHLQLGRRGAQ